MSLPRRISVSGQSAGASMAIQTLFAFSSAIDGAALLAGSPYGCGQQRFHSLACYYGNLDKTVAERYVRRRHSQGLIDDPKHLHNTPVLLFSGALDFVVLRREMHYVGQQLNAFGAAVRSIYNTSASHAWPIDHGSCACGACALGNRTGTSSM